MKYNILISICIINLHVLSFVVQKYCIIHVVPEVKQSGFPVAREPTRAVHSCLSSYIVRSEMYEVYEVKFSVLS